VINNTKFIIFLLGLIFSISSFAHGDLDERIRLVTAEINLKSDSSFLYIKRAELLYQHEDYLKSLVDLNKSQELNYSSDEQVMLFAKNYFELENYNKSLFFLQSILSHDTKNVLSIKLKAQAYLQLESYYDSALEFEKVIEFSTETFPENYIDASVAWGKLNTEAGNNRAVAIIKKGIENLGELISLYDRLIDLYIYQEKYQLAIDAQLHIIDLLSRKEGAFYKLSELYILDKNHTKALESIIMAKQYYYELPIRIQNTSFMKDLLVAIRKKEFLLHQINLKL